MSASPAGSENVCTKIAADCRAVNAACTRRTHGQRDAERCYLPRIPWTEDTGRGRSLVSLVDEKLTELLESPEAIKEACEDYLTALTGHIDQLESATGDVSREVAHWKRRQAELGEKWAAGDLSDRARPNVKAGGLAIRSSAPERLVLRLPFESERASLA